MAYAADYLGKSTPKLGFGLMRLPKIDDDTFDDNQISAMVDHFLDAGFTYFDTAFAYEGSEEAARRCLVERYPRDSYTIASKLFAGAAKTADEARREIDTTLERLGTDYLDFHLLHSVMGTNIAQYDEWGLWDYAKELKSTGKVRHIGFSYHSGPELLEQLLEAHPEVEFVQLQVNYADWEDPVVCSRRNVEVCQAHGIPFTIMEPVKGGSLAVPPMPVQQVLDAAGKECSYPSWAVRFAASHEGVLTVLSGMSTLEQLEDNVSYMRNFVPLDDEELAVLEKAQVALAGVDQIRCTACHYCTKGCPQQIPIPEIFSAVNTVKVWDNKNSATWTYNDNVAGGNGAPDCIACGQCEAACPQHLPIIELLQQAAEIFA